MIVSSVPVSLLVSLILLANEMRDYESDLRYGIGTLAVRIGYRAAVVLYCCLLAAAYGGALLLAPLGVTAHGWVVLLALPFAVPPFIFMLTAAKAAHADHPFRDAPSPGFWCAVLRQLLRPLKEEPMNTRRRFLVVIAVLGLAALVLVPRGFAGARRWG